MTWMTAKSIQKASVPSVYRTRSVFSKMVPAHWITSTPPRTAIYYSFRRQHAHEMTGLELKEKIHADSFLRTKGIPFVFISTNATAPAVRKAPTLSVEGYFEKPGSKDEIKRMLRILITLCFAGISIIYEIIQNSRQLVIKL